MVEFAAEKHVRYIITVEKAAAWIILAIFSPIRFQANYLLVVAICLTLSIANIIGFTKCGKVFFNLFQIWRQMHMLIIKASRREYRGGRTVKFTIIYVCDGTTNA
uniref:Golgi apparatus membrane protein TVP23 n=1 Tax=Opuntia streptacantha TaxID=393608 RepID=A0A7C9AXQ3_OPUST